MEYYAFDLQLFAEEGAAAGAATGGEITGGAAETETAAPEGISAGQELANGQQVSPQVAAAMNRQMKRHPELRKVYGAPAQRPQQPMQQPVQAEAEPEGNDPEAKWEALKKGEFKELYSRDVQNTIRERFKNQEDLQARLDAQQPIIAAAMKHYGARDEAELLQRVHDDDSLYEDEAERAGMTVEGFRTFQQMEAENQRYKEQEQRNQEQEFLRQHLAKMVQQGEELKQTFPNFDFRAEMENPTFRRLTSPEVGISVRDAYFAVHHDELAPQMLAYGMQRAQQQMGQTLQAQAARPAEGAMRNQNPAAAELKVNPRNLTRKEREAIKRRVHLGEVVSFD